MKMEKYGPVAFDVALCAPEVSDSKLRCSRPGVLTRTAGGRIPGRKLRKRRQVMMRRLVERRERLIYVRLSLHPGSTEKGAHSPARRVTSRE